MAENREWVSCTERLKRAERNLYIEARWRVSPDRLPPGHEAWMLEARYIALGLVSWICTLSPQRIIIGGGVMQQLDLFGLIRRELSSLLNGYIPARELTDSLDTYVVAPKLDDRSGVLGALIIAEEAVGQATSLPPDPDAQKLPGKNSEVP